MGSSRVDALRARPFSIAIGVTGKCNLRCSYCHKSDAVREARPAANADLPDDVIDGIYRYSKLTGLKHVTLSGGGETTMFDGWHQRIAQFLDDAEIESHIVSNFARIFSDDDLNALAKFRAIQISFDSADSAMVRKLRSKADLRTITINILRLRQKVRELGRRQTLIVNCTVWRDNIAGIAQLAGFCRELGIDQLLLTEGFVSTENNYTVPETLDTLGDEEVVLLAQQIVATEDALFDGTTSLRLQDHLRMRIGEVLEEVRQGGKPRDAAQSFQRTLTLSACRQPWQSPLVTQDGRVWACCVGAEEALIGDLANSTMAEILDSDAARAIRASILEGKPTLPCDGCSFASDLSLTDFAQDIREWQGDTAEPRETDVQFTVWPGLLSVPDHQVILENASLTVSQGIASLIENDTYGLHRVLVDIDNSTKIIFRMHPHGRRRLRLDLAHQSGHQMIGRLHVAAARAPTAEVTMGELCHGVTLLPDGWLEVTVRSSVPFSHINISLMRDDDAVLYRGDGKSAMEIWDLQISDGSRSDDPRESRTGRISGQSFLRKLLPKWASS
jgi:MoaA/NifB/PqqE/SkfB family radical SAM enzyme